MTKPFEKRLRLLENASEDLNKLSFRNVFPEDLARMKEIFLLARESGDWSHFYEDLARDAPSAYRAYREAGLCK